MTTGSLPPGTSEETGDASLPTRGLNLALAGISAIVLLVGLAAWLAIGSLEEHVNDWGGIEAVEGAMHDLEREIAEAAEHGYPHKRADIRNALDGLDRAIARLDETSRHGAFSTRATTLANEVRYRLDHVSDVELIRDRGRNGVGSQLKRMSSLVSAQAHQARRRLIAAEDASRILNRQQGDLVNNLNALLEIITSSDDLIRQVEAVLRFNASPAGADAPIRRLELDFGTIPLTCSGSPGGDPGSHCDPSPDRLLREAARISSAEDFDAALIVTATAARAYSRTASLRHAALSEELQEAIAGSARQHGIKTELRRQERTINQSVTTLTKLLATAERLTRTPRTALDALDARFWMGLRLVEMRYRETLERLVDPEDKALMHRAIARAGDKWTLALVSEVDLRDDLQILQSTLRSLRDLSNRTTADVRREAAGWFTIFSSTTLSVIVIFGTAIFIAVWTIYQHVNRPLTLVTGAILDLARGGTQRRLVLKSGGEGFRRLAQAVETLRRSNAERLNLLNRNAEQRAQIELQVERLELARNNLERQAKQDALTGLHNRRSAEETLSLVETAARTEGDGFAIIHFDLDRFKEINDTMGHEAGDFFLRHVATTLGAYANADRRFFRIGGDEFLVIVRGSPAREEVDALATEIIERLNEPVPYEGRTCRVGASAGIAFGADAGNNARTTLTNADLALYEAKNRGRNGIRSFNKSFQRRIIRHKELSDQILAGIERREFIPYYQPQYFSNTLALAGVETLCRWKHPDLGLLEPAAFFDCAHDLKAIGDIDQILFELVSRDMEIFAERGLAIPKISFNLTEDRLLHQDLAKTLRSAIDDDVAIAVELLESMSLDAPSESVRWSIDALKEQDIRIEIDDFGSCRASLAGLVAIGPDAMKIDRGIVSPMLQSAAHLGLVRAIVDIGKTLGIVVIAEGVESATHVSILKDIGCAILQGNVLATAMSADDLLAFPGPPKAMLTAA